jgi:branched-chain amino acid transport system substrate-binding protein
LKKIIFLIIAMVFVIGLILPGCGPTTPQIEILVAGPTTHVQGTHMVDGAQMAAKEINDLGGITLGGTNYKIHIDDIDTQEIDTPSAAEGALRTAISTYAPDFIIGGFRSEAVGAEESAAWNASTIFFITGAAQYDLLSGDLPIPYGKGAPYYEAKPSTSAGYKYIFRGTPFNDVFLLANSFQMMAMVANGVQSYLTGKYGSCNCTSHPVKIACLTEDLDWATPIEEGFVNLVGGLGCAGYKYFPWQLASDGSHPTGVWRVADDESAANLDTALSQIGAAGAHIIYMVLSGPVGLTFGKEYGKALYVSGSCNATAVGINVEGQNPTYWSDTSVGGGKYGAAYQIGLGTWAAGINMTSKTAAFLSKFVAKYGGMPVYTAATYDIVYAMKAAMLGVNAKPDAGGGANTNAIIAWYENVANKQLTTTGYAGYYGKWDQTTQGQYEGYNWPALNTSQVSDYYAGHGYDAAWNWTMMPYTTHDLVYGPRTTSDDPSTGWVTGIGVEWLSGVQVGVWPKAAYAALGNTFSRLVCGLNWTNMEYPGTSFYSLNPACEAGW